MFWGHPYTPFLLVGELPVCTILLSLHGRVCRVCSMPCTCLVSEQLLAPESVVLAPQNANVDRHRVRGLSSPKNMDLFARARASGSLPSCFCSLETCASFVFVRLIPLYGGGPGRVADSPGTSKSRGRSIRPAAGGVRGREEEEEEEEEEEGGGEEEEEARASACRACGAG